MFRRASAITPPGIVLSHPQVRDAVRWSADWTDRSRAHLERIGHAAFVRLPAWIGAERPQHRRELAEVRERARARDFVARDAEVDVEQVFPRPSRNRPR